MQPKSYSLNTVTLLELGKGKRKKSADKIIYFYQ